MAFKTKSVGSVYFASWGNSTAGALLPLHQLCPTRGPVESFARPSLGFRSGKSILYSDNLSLFWQSWIWHFWCRWSSV